MNLPDWKFNLSFGIAVGIIIFATKMDSAAAERVSIHAVDACKEFAIALKGDC